MSWLVLLLTTVALLAATICEGYRIRSLIRSAGQLSMSSAIGSGALSTSGGVVGRIRPTFQTASALAKAGHSWLRCRIRGAGSCAGKTVLHNNDFQGLVETSDEWIRKRTGISNRHILEPGTRLRDIATASARQTLERAQVEASNVDLVVLATSSPDDLFGDAASVAHAIGATNAVAFDLTAACSGFLFGVVTASQFVHNGAYKNALVVGADALTRWMDWKDRNSCILFGDGSGSVLVQSAEREDSGLLGFAMHSNGGDYEKLKLPYVSNHQTLDNVAATSADQGAYGKMSMIGTEVYKFATSQVPKVIREAVQNAGITLEDVDWIVLHQANIRIMEEVARSLGLPMSKVLHNISEYGNTSAGSIPLCLAEAVQAGQIKKGDVVVMAGFGAGLSWGAAVTRWD